MIYLASPYSHADPAVREERFQAVCRQASIMMRRGFHVFSPIAHTHPIAAYGLPLDWSFWADYDRIFLKMCGSVMVLKLEGWKESKGVKAEIALAKDLYKEVFYCPPWSETPSFLGEVECFG